MRQDVLSRLGHDDIAAVEDLCGPCSAAELCGWAPAEFCHHITRERLVLLQRVPQKPTARWAGWDATKSSSASMRSGSPGGGVVLFFRQA